jgi:aminoglycoside 3-N-acetyltransferase I
VRIERVTDVPTLMRGAALYDGPPRQASERFLASPLHHLLYAWDGDEAIGFVSGVETTHPEKGTEVGRRRARPERGDQHRPGVELPGHLRPGP